MALAALTIVFTMISLKQMSVTSDDAQRVVIRQVDAE